MECLVIGKPSLPTQRPDPNSGTLLYRLDVPVEFRDGSIGTAHVCHSHWARTPGEQNRLKSPDWRACFSYASHACGPCFGQEHSADLFCQVLSGTAAATLELLVAELELIEGSVIRCYPDTTGRLPPSLRPPPTLPDVCAPPALLYDWYLTAGIYLLVVGVPLVVWAFVRCFYRIFERVDKEEQDMPQWAGR